MEQKRSRRICMQRAKRAFFQTLCGVLTAETAAAVLLPEKPGSCVPVMLKALGASAAAAVLAAALTP